MLLYKQPPEYYAKIIRRDGVALAAPLDAGAIEFTNTCFVPGTSQQDVGAFTIQLRDTENDPTARHLRATYDLLNYQQFVEIYDRADCLGTPVFSGVITELPDDLGSAQVRGLGILHELEKRRLRRYHTLSGNAGAVVAQLLKTYNVVFKDDFNRASIGGAWSFTPGNWEICGNALRCLNVTGDPTINTVASYTVAQWNCARLAIDINPNSLIADYAPAIFFVGTYPSNLGYLIQMVNFNAEVTQIAIAGLRAGSTINELRGITYEFDQWNHLEIFTQDEGGKLRIIVTLNGNEVFNLLDDIGSADGRFGFMVGTGGGSVPTPSLFDNVVFSVGANALTKGAFDLTTTVVNQVFNADTQLDAIRWIANQCGGWLYRVNPQAGVGADTLDFGAEIGRDLSNVVILEAGKNIVDLQRNRTSDGLVTSLMLTGQAQDDASAAFIANALSAFDTFGIIEAIESDERVVDTATAKAIAEWRLDNTSAGSVSLSGTILDESALFQQTPIIGSAVIGDFIIGGRQALREGDRVWLKWDAKGIDRQVRVISITRKSGDPSTRVIFEYFPWRRKDELARLRAHVTALTRVYLNRRNPRSFHFEFAADETQTRYFYPVGYIVSTRLDIILASGAPTYKVYLDGTDRTLELFGAATLSATAHAIDTTYLNLAGEHSIGIEVTTGSPAVFDIDVQPGILS